MFIIATLKNQRKRERERERETDRQRQRQRDRDGQRETKRLEIYFSIFRGESAFWHLQVPIAWARRPMLERLDSLNPDIPLSIIYGTRSWFDNSTGEKVFAMRPESYVDVHFVKGAGHHIHADTPEVFNEIVKYICQLTDENKDIVHPNVRRSEQDAFFTH